MPEHEATPEDRFLDRRRFVRELVAAGVALVVGPSLVAGCSRQPTVPDGRGPLDTIEPGSPNLDLYPAGRNPSYKLDRRLTDELTAATNNNFYEFSSKKEQVWKLVDGFKTRPWTVEITGHVDNPGVHDVDQLARRMGLEERLYRLRCVEAWSVAVPWTGFPLARLVELAKPRPEARFLSFLSFHDPTVAPGQRDRSFPWPYYEGLTLAEATNELAFIATGIYGHELPKQHGAPLRLVVPWKYGFKNIKSFVRIEFTASQPRTFWSDIAPHEYGFWSNVRPDIPHPRWSQAFETWIGTGEKRPTLPYNGYAEQVAHLYGGAGLAG